MTTPVEAVPMPGELVPTNSEALAPKEGVGCFLKVPFEGVIRGFQPGPGVTVVQVFLHGPNGRPLEKVIGEAVNVGDFLTVQLRNDTDQIQTARGHWAIERKTGTAKTAPSPAAAPSAAHPAAQGPQALARIAVAKIPAPTPREEIPARAAVTATPPPPPSTLPEMPSADVPVATPAQALGAVRSMAKATGEVLVLMRRAQAEALLSALKLKGDTLIHGNDLAPLCRALEDSLRT